MAAQVREISRLADPVGFAAAMVQDAATYRPVQVAAPAKVAVRLEAELRDIGEDLAELRLIVGVPGLYRVEREEWPEREGWEIVTVEVKDRCE